jgi:glycosyltransferase involved in cell wall biosynthesis
MNVLIAGPNSVHVSNFVEQIGFPVNLVVEEVVRWNNVKNQYVVDFKSFNLFKLIGNWIKLFRFVKKFNPDVIHIHQVNRLAFFLIMIATRLKIPCVVTAWGSDVLLMPQRNKLFFQMIRYVLSKAKYVTADSVDMISAMNKVYAHSDKYILLQYGIDLVPHGKKENIIFSNRLHEPIYQIDKVINLFSEFVKNNKEWKLIIAGIGSETAQLNKIVNDLDILSNVQFVGWLNKEMNFDYYTRSKIYISLPKSDGMSVSVLEAMSAGCIPIVPDLDVSREWIQDAVNGIIYKNELNPIMRALSLDQERVAIINLNIVKNKATRSDSNKVFVELYVNALIK